MEPCENARRRGQLCGSGATGGRSAATGTCPSWEARATQFANISVTARSRRHVGRCNRQSTKRNSDFKQVPEIIKQAKAVQAAVPAESADQLVTQMVTNWRVQQLRSRLDVAALTMAKIEPTLDKSKVPSLEWFSAPAGGGNETAASRGDLDAALAKYAEIEKAGLTWLVMSNELNQLVWMGGLGGAGDRSCERGRTLAENRAR